MQRRAIACSQRVNNSTKVSFTVTISHCEDYGRYSYYYDGYYSTTAKATATIGTTAVEDSKGSPGSWGSSAFRSSSVASIPVRDRAEFRQSRELRVCLPDDTPVMR